MTAINIAKRWKELNGENKWEGLLDPIDVDLRHNLIFYGEAIDAMHDTFINDSKSKHAGCPRFLPQNMLSKATTMCYGQEYYFKVTKYIYGNSSMSNETFKGVSGFKDSNWIGFVAVASDEGKEFLGRRDILVAWRGTITTSELIQDDRHDLVEPIKDLNFGNNVKVHHGFHCIYTANNPQVNEGSARDQVLAEVTKLLNQYKDKDEELSITITGYSLGAALTALSSLDIITNGINKISETESCPMTAFSYACPRVGEANFKDFFESKTDLKLLRVTNKDDIVTKIPITDYQGVPYYDVGVELKIDNGKSPFLKNDGGFLEKLRNAHNLDCYLHGISGYQGIDKDFKLAFDRDIALVNRVVDVLLDKYMVPSFWFRYNKRMVKGSDGHWRLDDKPEGLSKL